ncbi:TPM domain-containing protein [uncultured Flavobacterium sp.]|uniref:TPM domain-containing protein n=1 Tax=uncultured Flavobacterium sp. TaxID=165435 RepID=UPI0030CA45E3
MSNNITKLIILIVLISIFSCKKENIDLPKVDFDFKEIPKDKKYKENVYLIDLEKLFNSKEKIDLEKYLKDIDNKNRIKIRVLTIPSKNTSDKEWEISSFVSLNGIIINMSKSMKKIDIACDTNINTILTEKIKESIITENIIPEVSKGNYYIGLKKGLSEIVSLLKKKD